MYERDEEVTGQFEHDELLGLLNTTAAVEQQRITARIPVITLAELLKPGNDQEPPPDVVVRFRQAPHPLLMISEYGWAMIVASFLATVTFGLAAMITLY